MEQVTGYRTTDGNMFDDKLKAMDHQLRVDFQAVINRGKESHLEPALAMRKEREFIYNTIQTYNRRLSSMAASARKGK